MAEYAVQSNYVRGLSKKQYEILRELCRYSNNLYNVGLYNIRQHFFAEKKFLNYESAYHIAKENENYGMLQAGVAQQTLRVVDRSFKSFFNLLKKCKQGEYRYQQVKIPHYRKQGGLFNLVLSTNAINIRDGYIQIPVSHKFKAEHPDMKPIRIRFPERLEGKTIKEVRVIPYHSGKCFKIQYVYEIEQECLNLDTNNMLAIDIGVDNFAACISTEGTSFLVDGRKLKSINHQYNKELARLKQIASLQGYRTTHRIQKITDKRNRRVSDYIKKTARYIINHCIEHSIGTIIVGYNLELKQGIRLGKETNQNFVQIPFGDLRQQLEFLCWKYGIEYVEQEESYTSKSSFLDNDVLPVYKAEQPYQGKFSGKRVYRGLYKSKNGTVMNADLNGAANIMRKCKQNLDSKRLYKGLLASPERIVLC